MSFTPAAIRWLRFSGVGMAGIAFQLAVFAVLTLKVGAPIATATAVAVEAAVLHNFAWHQHWTWRDRPSPTLRNAFARLLRFHAVNGLVSLAGNIVLTLALTQAGLHPIAANLGAIALCSVMNFGAAERLVFRRCPVDVRDRGPAIAQRIAPASFSANADLEKLRPPLPGHEQAVGRGVVRDAVQHIRAARLD